MAETPEEVAKRVMRETGESHSREGLMLPIAAALRAQRVAALEAAALEYADPKLESIKVYCRHVAQRLRELAEQAKAGK